MAQNRRTIGSAGALAALLAAAAAADDAAQVIVHGDGGGATQPRERIVGASIGAATTLSAVSSSVERVVVRSSPEADEVALLTEDDTGRLTLRLRTDGSWGSDMVVTGDAGGGSARGFDAAYEHRSGELLIAYRKSGLTWIYARTYDGSLSSESSYDLSLGATPARVVLHPNVRSDAALLVASSGTDLHAALWTDGAFGDPLVADSAYDGGTGAWDATHHPGSGEPMVVWARTTDVSPRVRRFSGGAWQAEESGPSLGLTIERVQLGSDPASGGRNVLAGFGTSSSGERLTVAWWDGSSWSSSTTIASDLAGTGEYPFAVSFEGDGGGAVAAWAEEGDDFVKVKRWNGSAWGGSSSSGTVGDDIAAISAAPRDAEAAAVVAAVCSETSGGAAYAEYVAYSKSGELNLSGVTVTGSTAEGGTILPSAPAVSSGSPSLSYGNNEDVTISPGSYGNLSVGNQCTLRLSAGQYVFSKFSSEKNGTSLVCDTSGGDVEIVILGDVHFKNDPVIERNGSGIVLFHIDGGNLELKNGADFEAVVFVYDGEISMGNNATIVGHLYAKSDVTIGSGSLTEPSWPIPGASGSTTQSAGAFIVSNGSVGSVTTLGASDWTAASGHPLAIGHRVGASSRAIVRWREIEPDL